MLYLRFLAHLLSLLGIRAVGVILVDRKGRFFVQQRELIPRKDDEFSHPARSYLKGRWAIPAGYVEKRETPAQAVVREMREELGIEIERPKLVVRASWPRPVCLYASGTPAPIEALQQREAMDQRFVTLAEVPELSPRIHLLHSVLRAFASTAAYEECQRNASA